MRVLPTVALFGMCSVLGGCDSRPPPADTSASLPDSTLCTNYHGLPAHWQHSATSGMVKIAGGAFSLGSEAGYPDEKPLAQYRTREFWIDRTEVTNAQFAAFVSATGYVTEAELTRSSAVFQMPTPQQIKNGGYSWWVMRAGFDWRHPFGPKSQAIDNQPVVHITQRDALAYAHWLGRDLPTEAEWEYAAKAGRNDAALDSEPVDDAGRPTANYWQGSFPQIDTGDDGFKGLAPVGCFGANAFRLYDMIGNVWEWTRDAEAERTSQVSITTVAAATATTTAATENQTPARAIIKGGSFLCSRDFCVRYRAAAREAQESDLSSSHVGFRTVFRPQ